MCTPWLEGVEGDEARTLIESDESVIRVVAGPGSGKTFCLQRRVQRLVEGLQVAPDSIFIGTFTRAIADKLRDELGTDIQVSTIHSLAYKLLRDNPAACSGLKLRFLLQYEEEAMLYDIADDFPNLDRQSKRKKELLRLQSARAEREELPDARFDGAIHRWLLRHGGMTIGEVVHLAVQGLESEDISPGQYDHVIVDEYQDLTASEQELVELIWSGNGSLVVLGDNDQSIYSFRFNHPDGIDEFTTRWEGQGLSDIGIPENRRCGELIVNIANLIMAELGSTKDPMISESGRIGDVSLIQWNSIDAEIDGLAAYVRARSDESFLMLVPRRFIGYRLKDAIGEDARTVFHQEVLEHQAIQERFAAASVLANPDDLVAVRAWLGLHGLRSIQANKRNADAYASLPVDIRGSDLIRGIASSLYGARGSGSNHVRARARQLVDWLDSELTDDLPECIEFLFNPSIAASVEEDPERQRWLATDLSTLRALALSLIENEGMSTLEKVVEALRYRIATRIPIDTDEMEPRVKIMTLYSAKGLEADNIILAGIADQVVPGPDTELSKQAEQARLLYVAVTRAKNNLVVSWCRSIPYADAKPNQFCTDRIQTIRGIKLVVLSRSRLLPQSLGGVKRGPAWLVEEGITERVNDFETPF